MHPLLQLAKPSQVNWIFPHQNMQLACIRTAIDLKLFELLTQADGPLTVDQLSESTGANPVFMGM